MKILLDTSVISAFFDDRLIERQSLTREFWKILKIHQIFVAEITLKEIQLISDRRLKAEFLKLIKPFKILKVTNEIRYLAQICIESKIIPKQYINDALLIATASVNQLDVLMSWNFKHIVNLKVKTKVNAINTLYNFPTIELCSPGELL